jgi:uncharacterized protein YdaU (DUF1376 family)
MKTSPAFQFYPADFLVGTADMTAEEVGGYIRLLCYQWTKGSLPDDNKKLMQLALVFDLEAMKSIRTKFESRKDGTIVNLKMESVRIKQEEYSETQRIKANKLWESKRNAGASNQQDSGSSPEDALQSPSSNSILLTTTTEVIIPDPTGPDKEIFNWDKLLAFMTELFGKKFKVVNPDTRRKINARINQGWTKQDVQNAMLVVQADEFHRENGYKYVTPEYFGREKTLQLYATKKVEQGTKFKAAWE